MDDGRQTLPATAGAGRLVGFGGVPGVVRAPLRDLRALRPELRSAAAVLHAGAGVLPAAAELLQLPRPARTDVLEPAAGRPGLHLPAVSAHVMTLWPWCRSYQLRSSVSQFRSDRRATTRVAAATSAGPSSPAREAGTEWAR
jgi:hypothetical protein